MFEFIETLLNLLILFVIWLVIFFIGKWVLSIFGMIGLFVYVLLVLGVLSSQ